MQDARYKILEARYRIQDSRYRMTIMPQILFAQGQRDSGTFFKIILRVKVHLLKYSEFKIK